MVSPSEKEIKKNKSKYKKSVKSQAWLSKLKAILSGSPVSSAVFLSIIIGITVNVLAGLILYQRYVVRERQQQVEAFSAQNAQLAAANVNKYMQGVYERLSYFAKSRSLATSLTYKDTEGVLEIQSAVRNGFPLSLSARIFGVGEAVVEITGESQLRFAEVENIHKAERRETVFPECLDIGGGWRINVVVPVPEDASKPVAGTIFISLPVTELYEQLSKGLENVGKVSIFQTFSGKTRLMSSFGDGDLFTAERVKVPNSPWEVEFVASQALLEKTQIDHTFLLLMGVIGSLVCLAFFIIIGLAVGRQIHRKQQALENTHKKMGRKQVVAEQNSTDFHIREEDEELLGFADEDEDEEDVSEQDPLEIVSSAEEDEAALSVPEVIFRSYDIRGVVGPQITNDLALQIGKALGSEALEQGETALIVARDARIHSPILMENLIRGILSTGCRVLNIGTVPTPLLYFAAEVLTQTSSGVMVTASHNPAEYNGFKVVMKGKSRTPEDIQAVRDRILKQDFRFGIGSEETVSVVELYIETIFADVALAGEVKIVIDAGNGVTGKVAPQLFELLGCKVVPLYCDLDGNFPHHGPDPSVEANLQDLIARVKEENADIGVAFDGDGDRLTVVTPTGQIIWADRLLMLFARDILARNPGADVVFDVKSSRQLNSVISSGGGRPIMWKTGHAPMRAKVQETGALVGGEFSGHIFIKDRWYGFDDGMYAAARLIEIMSLRDEPLDQIFAEFLQLKITPEYRVPIAEEKKFGLIQRLIEHGKFGDAKRITIDGLRVEFHYGWGLVRASNTSAELSLRFEAETDEQLHQLKALFTREIRSVDPTIEIRW